MDEGTIKLESLLKNVNELGFSQDKDNRLIRTTL